MKTSEVCRVALVGVTCGDKWAANMSAKARINCL